MFVSNSYISSPTLVHVSDEDKMREKMIAQIQSYSDDPKNIDICYSLSLKGKVFPDIYIRLIFNADKKIGIKAESIQKKCILITNFEEFEPLKTIQSIAQARGIGQIPITVQSAKDQQIFQNAIPIYSQEENESSDSPRSVEVSPRVYLEVVPSSESGSEMEISPRNIDGEEEIPDARDSDSAKDQQIFREAIPIYSQEENESSDSPRSAEVSPRTFLEVMPLSSSGSEMEISPRNIDGEEEIPDARDSDTEAQDVKMTFFEAEKKQK